MRCARPYRRAGHADLPDIAADMLARMRARAPRVHCITNAVAQTFTANMLLAAGAVPSMTIAPDEVAAFVARADALLVNLGTFDRRAARGGRASPSRRAGETRALGARSGVHRPLAARAPPMPGRWSRRRRAPSASTRAEFAALAGSEPATLRSRDYARDTACVLGAHRRDRPRHRRQRAPRRSRTAIR